MISSNLKVYILFYLILKLKGFKIKLKTRIKLFFKSEYMLLISQELNISNIETSYYKNYKNFCTYLVLNAEGLVLLKFRLKNPR